MWSRTFANGQFRALNIAIAARRTYGYPLSRAVIQRTVRSKLAERIETACRLETLCVGSAPQRSRGSAGPPVDSGSLQLCVAVFIGKPDCQIGTGETGWQSLMPAGIEPACRLVTTTPTPDSPCCRSAILIRPGWLSLVTFANGMSSASITSSTLGVGEFSKGGKYKGFFSLGFWGWGRGSIDGYPPQTAS